VTSNIANSPGVERVAVMMESPFDEERFKFLHRGTHLVRFRGDTHDFVLAENLLEGRHDELALSRVERDFLDTVLRPELLKVVRYHGREIDTRAGCGFQITLSYPPLHLRDRRLLGNFRRKP